MNRNYIYAIYILCVCIIVAIFLINDNNKYDDKVITELSYHIIGQRQKAYAEGQRDALNDDIRIKKIDDSTYVWVESPWNGTELCVGDTLILDFVSDTITFDKN